MIIVYRLLFLGGSRGRWAERRPDHPRGSAIPVRWSGGFWVLWGGKKGEEKFCLKHSWWLKSLPTGRWMANDRRWFRLLPRKWNADTKKWLKKETGIDAISPSILQTDDFCMRVVAAAVQVNPSHSSFWKIANFKSAGSDSLYRFALPAE